ncbi:response regulator [Candidatus Neomarinimicrobiota bacterium]
MSEANILLVDDDPDTRNIVPRILSKCDYTVSTCSSGSKALERLAQEHFDLVLSDVRMPGMSGFELLKSIRDSYPDLPVILLTAIADLDSEMEAVRADMHGYLRKPYTAVELTDAVREMLSRFKPQV